MWLLICPNCRWGADFYSDADPGGHGDECSICGAPTPSYEVRGTEGMQMSRARSLLIESIGDLGDKELSGWHTYTNKRLIDRTLKGLSPLIDENDLEYHLERQNEVLS